MEKKDVIKLGISIATASVITLAILYRKDIYRATKFALTKQVYYDPSKTWHVQSKWGVTNRQRIEELHPIIRNKVVRWFDKMEEKYGLLGVVTSGCRSYSAQAAIDDKDDRNAEAGYSDHNYCLGLDVNFIDKKTGKFVLKKATPLSKWEESGAVKEARKRGLKWEGKYGDYYDPVHFYFRPDGMTIKEVRQRYLSGQTDKDGYVKLS